MERCKFCGEVLEGGNNFCPHCGKDVKKVPSKKFLKKQEKEKNFKPNYDARLYRVSYKIFGILFLLAGLVTMVFYAGNFLAGALEKPTWAINYMDVINKAGDIYTKVNDWVPFMAVKELSLTFIVASVVLVLTILSLFTKKFSWGALFYKLSAIFGVIFFVVQLTCAGAVPFAVPEAFVEFILENEKIIVYSGAGAAIFFFVMGLLFSFNVKNPYRPTLYQGHKALYWMLLTIPALVGQLAQEFTISATILETIDTYYNYTLLLMPAYIFVASLLLFIGAKYRGNIEKLK